MKLFWVFFYGDQTYWSASGKSGEYFHFSFHLSCQQQRGGNCKVCKWCFFNLFVWFLNPSPFPWVSWTPYDQLKIRDMPQECTSYWNYPKASLLGLYEVSKPWFYSNGSHFLYGMKELHQCWEDMCYACGLSASGWQLHQGFCQKALKDLTRILKARKLILASHVD